MAFPINGVLEDFTGTDGTSPPNANWTNGGILTAGGIQISSNHAKRVTAGSFS